MGRREMVYGSNTRTKWEAPTNMEARIVLQTLTKKYDDNLLN